MNRILLVDDLPIFRELGSIFLERSGPVDLAHSAADAFQLVRENRPRIVIADMHLPDLPGPDLCRRLKSGADWGNPRVVLLARPDSSEDHAEGVRAGADAVLFKPLERDALISTVRRLVDFETPRGLPRAEIERPVEILARGERIKAHVRNVSRGGLLVDSPVHFSHSEEVGLNFSLNGDASFVSPTAQVIWSDPVRDGRDQVGLRFLEIDADTVHQLEYYVSDHFPVSPSLPA